MYKNVTILYNDYVFIYSVYNKDYDEESKL